MNFLRFKFQEAILYIIFYSILLTLSILPMGSFRLGKISAIFPNIEIAIIFYFSIFKPHILPVGLLFCYGIIIDLVYGLPIGISIIPFIITNYTLREQRQIFYKKDFPIVFSGFALSCILFLTIKFLIFTWYFSFYRNYLQIIMQGICTLFAYPFLHSLLFKIEKIID